MEKPKRILIVRTDRIGDVVLTLPLADVIKKNQPDAFVSMLVRQYTAELVDKYKNIDETIVYDENTKPVSFFKILKLIKSYSFDAVVVAYPRFRIALLMAIAGIPLRIGTAYRFYSFFFNRRVHEHRKHVKKHELEYNLSLLQKLNFQLYNIQPPWIFPDNESLNSVATNLEKLGIQKDENIIIIHPGTGGSTRRWSTNNFIKLCNKLSKLEKNKIVLTGSLNEKDLILRIKNEVENNTIDFAGKLSLMEYAALAKYSRVFVGNSTGPLHIAAAVGTPVVGLYPQIPVLSAKRWGPYTDKCKILSPKNKPINCKKCKKLENCECMDSISVDEVFEAVKFFLN